MLEGNDRLLSWINAIEGFSHNRAEKRKEKKRTLNKYFVKSYKAALASQRNVPVHRLQFRDKSIRDNYNYAKFIS